MPSHSPRALDANRFTADVAARVGKVGLLALLLLALGGCDDNDDPPSDLITSATIGPEGGSIQVPSGEFAGASITIPPGALAAPVGLSFHDDSVTLTPGFTDVGPALRIDPEGLELLLPALLTLPFDPTLVPPATTIDDYIVRYRIVDGRVFDAQPRQVDQSLGKVTLDVLQLATWWVTVPDVIVVRDYLPLGSGDNYQYTGDLGLGIVETRVEPNFTGIPVTKATFAAPVAGIYFAKTTDGALLLLGEFEISIENRQERLDGAVTLLRPVEPIGTSRELFYTFTGFIPFGGIVPAYLGAAHTTVTLVNRTSIAVPAGIFEDVVLLEVVVERGDSRPRTSTETFRLWLAGGVGPVQVQVNQNTPHQLISGTVGGVPIGN